MHLWPPSIHPENIWIFFYFLVKQVDFKGNFMDTCSRSCTVDKAPGLLGLVMQTHHNTLLRSPTGTQELHPRQQ